MNIAPDLFVRVAARPDIWSTSPSRFRQLVFVRSLLREAPDSPSIERRDSGREHRPRPRARTNAFPAARPVWLLPCSRATPASDRVEEIALLSDNREQDDAGSSSTRSTTRQPAAVHVGHRTLLTSGFVFRIASIASSAVPRPPRTTSNSCRGHCVLRCARSNDRSASTTAGQSNNSNLRAVTRTLSTSARPPSAANAAHVSTSEPYAVGRLIRLRNHIRRPANVPNTLHHPRRPAPRRPSRGSGRRACPLR